MTDTKTNQLWQTIYHSVEEKHPDWSHKRVYVVARGITADIAKRAAAKSTEKAPAEA